MKNKSADQQIKQSAEKNYIIGLNRLNGLKNDNQTNPFNPLNPPALLAL